MPTTADVIRIAAAEVGYSRYSDPLEGTKYGRWYAKLTNSPYFGTTGVHYCAMFVSWVFAQAKVVCKGFPTASCTSVLLKPAYSGGYLIRPAYLRKGDAVLFDWSGAGYQGINADHVGIVVANHGTYLETIEGNVSGAVKRCTRDIKYVVGGIRPSNYSEQQPDVQTLVVDGDFGPLTKTALQTRLAKAGCYDRDIDGDFGYWSYLGLQRYLRVKGYYTTDYLLDGDFGYYSVLALQRYLRKLGYYTTAYLLDGDWGKYTTIALQKALNAGRF